MTSLRHPHRQAFARMFALQTETRAATAADPERTVLDALDPLTGLLDASSFRRAFQRQVLHALRSAEPLTLALLGLDSFHGEREDDIEREAVVTACARRLAESFRDGDVLARWSAQEFAVLFPRTLQAGGRRAVEKALRAICATRLSLPRGAQAELSLSAGIVGVVPGAPFAAAIEEAAQLLRQAQGHGRARICWAEGTSSVLPRRVVLLSADPAIEWVLGGGFGDEGLHVIAPGPNAVARAEAIGAGMLLFDLDGFDASGWKVLGQLQTSERLGTLPVLVISSDPAHLVRSLQAGADDFVPRSAPAEELLARADRLMRRRRAP